MLLTFLYLARQRAQKISEPVLALTNASTRFARGEQIEDLPVLQRDEIGGLTDDFNHMRRTIHERESTLAARGARLRATFETVVDALIVTDAKGEILAVNRAANQILDTPAMNWSDATCGY
jgi:nitrogen fixation/metabolism regulation signal transduction histidine kinase